MAGTLGSSVLTLILLVVLCGGLGLLAVSMAESSKPATPDRRSPRATTGGADPTGVPDATSLEPDPDDGTPTDPGARDPAPADVAAALATEASPRRVRLPAQVPRSQIALEGAFAEVARPSVPRRAASLFGIVAIVVVAGVAIAAVLGAIVGGFAEILGNTIG